MCECIYVTVCGREKPKDVNTRSYKIYIHVSMCVCSLVGGKSRPRVAGEGPPSDGSIAGGPQF